MQRVRYLDLTIRYDVNDGQGIQFLALEESEIERILSRYSLLRTMIDGGFRNFIDAAKTQPAA